MEKSLKFVLTILSAFVVIYVSAAMTDGDRPQNKYKQPKFMEQLNDEQKHEIKTLMDEMRDNGATKKEVHEAVRKKLLEYGIDPPERGKGPGHHGFFAPGFWEIADQLSEDQKNAIKEKVESMHKEGSDPEEIHHEIRKMLEIYGVEVPDHLFKRPPRGMRHGWEFLPAELTAEQEQAIKEKVKSMRESDATREEIHDTITQMMKEFGVEIPEDLRNHREVMRQLSAEQRKEVHRTIRTMRKEGASHAEIREAVDRLLKGYGIILPESNPINENNQQEQGRDLEIQNFPNPFNPETRIQYFLPSDSEVSIRIYDVQGKQVRELLNEGQSSGTYTITWDGFNDSGNQVPSGVYFIRLSTGDETLSKRIVMTK